MERKARKSMKEESNTSSGESKGQVEDKNESSPQKVSSKDKQERKEVETGVLDETVAGHGNTLAMLQNKLLLVSQEQPPSVSTFQHDIHFSHHHQQLQEFPEEEDRYTDKFFELKPTHSPNIVVENIEQGTTEEDNEQKTLSKPAVPGTRTPPNQSDTKPAEVQPHKMVLSPKFSEGELHNVDKYFLQKPSKSSEGLSRPVLKRSAEKGKEGSKLATGIENVSQSKNGTNVEKTVWSNVKLKEDEVVPRKSRGHSGRKTKDESFTKIVSKSSIGIIATPSSLVTVEVKSVEEIGSELSSDSFINSVFSSDKSGTDKRPDMSWILKNDDVDDSNSKLSIPPVSDDSTSSKHRRLHHESFTEIRQLLSIITILGRLPFEICTEGGGSFRCKMKRSWRKWDLYILTSILVIPFILCSLSVASILTTRVEDSGHRSEYAKFEKLLFQKHWLHVTVFLVTLLLVLVGNLNFILEGQRISTYINDVGKSLEELNYDNASHGSRAMKFFHLFILILDATTLILLVNAQDLGFWESLQFETILYLRWTSSEAFLKSFMNYVPYIFISLEIYVYFVARNHLLLIVALCRPITNSARGWNSRTACLLGTVAPKEVISQQPYYERSLSYRALLKHHRIITDLVREVSGCFTPILFTYFLTRVLCICCELFRASTTFFFDLTLKGVNGSDTISGNTNLKVKYDPTEEESVAEIVYFLGTTLLGLFMIVETISAVGETVMNGFEPVRRYGLLLADSLKGRKFIMSLYMSFNAKKPHIVKPGRWFTVNKGLFLSILGTALLLFSIMIQWEVVNLVETQIVLACPGDTSNICFKSVVVNSRTEDVKKIIESNPRPTFKQLSTTEKIHPNLPTTTAKTKPHCPPPTGKNFVEITAPEKDKRMKCGLLCPFTQVYRLIPYSSDSSTYIISMAQAWNWNKMKTFSVDCLANSYKFVRDKSIKHVYDCFGTCYQNIDDLGRFALTLGNPDPDKPKEKVKDIPQEFALPAECFSEYSKGSVTHSPSFHPLEVCGLPYAYVKTIYEYYSNKNGQADVLLRDLVKLFPNNYQFDVQERLCDVTNNKESHPYTSLLLHHHGQPAYYKKINAFSYLYGKPQKINVESWGQVWENKKGFIEPKTEDSKWDTVVHAYSYMHPYFTSLTGSFIDMSFGTFGLYDCFGNPLDELDECGGLPFTKNGEKPKKRKERVPGTTKRFTCWESIFPKYKCGVPENLAFKVCTAWDEYIKMIKEPEFLE